MTAKEAIQQCRVVFLAKELVYRSKNGTGQVLKLHTERINYYRFEQFEFFRQWHLLHNYAREKDIQLFGDLPIYVSYDSVDVWANQEIFTLDRENPSTDPCRPGSLRTISVRPVNDGGILFTIGRATTNRCRKN